MFGYQVVLGPISHDLPGMWKNKQFYMGLEIQGKQE